MNNRIILSILIAFSLTLVGCSEKKENNRNESMVVPITNSGGGPNEWVKWYVVQNKWWKKNGHEEFVDVTQSVVNEENGKFYVYSVMHQGSKEDNEPCFANLHHDCPVDLGVMLTKFLINSEIGTEVKLTLVGKSNDITCTVENCKISTFKINSENELAWIVLDSSRVPCFPEPEREYNRPSVTSTTQSIYALFGKKITQLYESDDISNICTDEEDAATNEKSIAITRIPKDKYFDLQIDEYKSDKTHKTYNLHFNKEKNQYLESEPTKLKNSPM